MSLEQLSWYVDNNVAKRLLSVEGMAEVRRSGGVSREIRIILDPAKMQANGITAVQVNAQLRQVNVNAAGGRAEIAGSEQSVRVLGNAASAYALGETQIALPGGRTVKLSAIADVRDAYAEQRSLSTMNGRQVLSFRLTRAKGYSDVTVYEEAMKALKQLEKDNPEGQVHPDVHQRRLCEVAISQRDGGDGRGRRARRPRRPAVPARLARDPHLGARHPALGHPDLLVHGPDGLLAERPQPARAEPGRRSPGRRRDRRDREYRPPHADGQDRAYQAAIDAADEIGLAVVATTFSIVAVFMPVGLMPGISGQFFKNFGFTVVAAVLTSLAVARLITPLAAAYFLKAKGKAKPRRRLDDGPLCRPAALVAAATAGRR